MKEKAYFKKILIVCAICLMILASIPIVQGDTNSSESISSDENNISTKGSTTYNNCKIIISGRCNTVTGPLFWIFGFYCPLRDRDFKVEANGEFGEKLNVVVLKPEFGAWLSYEHIEIRITQAQGFFYWGGKSLIFDEPRIFAYCTAQEVTIYD
jgi:hypothetical protein